MAISITVDQSCFKERCGCSKIAPYLDLIVGFALTIIGALGLYQVIGISASISYISVGAGVTYTGLVAYRAIAHFICKCNCL